jgi:hypothetical protein
MNDTCIYTRDYRIRLANGLRCPHCAEPLTPHAIERRDPAGEWSIVCQRCHRDVLDVSTFSAAK